MLGLTVSVVGLFAFFMWADTHQAGDATPVAAAAHSHDSAPAVGADVHAHTTAAGGGSDAHFVDRSASYCQRLGVAALRELG